MTETTPKVSTGPLPASIKIYKPGRLYPEIRVPMREIAVHPTAGEPNLPVYDSSGPYTAASADIDIGHGIARLRESWALAQADSFSYEGRHIQPADNGFATGERLTREFPRRNRPRRAHDGKAVTQLAYARAGIITPE
ncbi:MAG: phosphomethylpyrimidine synthase ThiC, partial [Alphaproteobacteria bacterium]